MNEESEEISALVREFNEGGHAESKVVDISVINYISHNVRGKYMIAAMAWWSYKGQLKNFEWDLMQCEPQEAQLPYDFGVFMVHEGRNGNHDLVSYDEKSGAFLIYGDLECKCIMGTVYILS